MSHYRIPVIRNLTVFIMCMCISGCFGTGFSRINNYGGDFCGNYPYSGTVAGFKALGPLNILTCPIDLVVDTILLPVDLISWPLGFDKNNRSGGCLFSEAKYGHSSIDYIKKLIGNNANMTVEELRVLMKNDFCSSSMMYYWDIYKDERDAVVSFGIINKETKIKYTIISFQHNDASNQIIAPDSKPNVPNQ